jgi:ribonuclease R
MSAHLDGLFEGTVTSVLRFGAFVQLDATQADGLIPVDRLGQGWFTHDPTHHALIGERRDEVIALGDRVVVRLTRADSWTGQLTFDLVEHTPGPAALAALKAGRTPSRRSGPPGRTFRRRQPRR